MARLAQKLSVADHPKSPLRPSAAPRLDLWDFLAHREGFKKTCFLGIAPKRQKSEDKSNLGGPCRHFGQKNIRRTRRVLGVLNSLRTTREPIRNQPTPSLNPSPAGPEITIWADRVRLISGFLAVPFGTLFSHRFVDVFFLVFSKC